MVREARPKGPQSRGNSTPARKPPVSRISKIASLKRYADREYAESLLHEVAKLVAPIIHENNFKVGVLCEMFPKDANLLGLNVNRGSKILIRLRYASNERSFYPMGDIVGTFLHELTHNIYGAHDDRFYNFLDGLKKRFEQIQYNPGSMIGNYVMVEEKLGLGSARGQLTAGYRSINDKRIAKLGKGQFKAEVRKLGSLTDGGGGGVGGIRKPRTVQGIRSLLLEAAERRLRDSKWCPTNNQSTQDVEPNQNELEIIEIDDDYDSVSSKQPTNDPPTNDPPHHSSGPPPNKLQDYRDVIDLTEEGADIKSEGSSEEIIVVDACEDDRGNQARPNNQQQPQLLAPLEESAFDTSPISTSATQAHHQPDENEILYTFSSSPGRTFFDDHTDDRYPRRKLVAELDFDEIIRKSDDIRLIQSRSKSKAKSKPKSRQKSASVPKAKAKAKSKPKSGTSKKEKSNKEPRRKRQKADSPGEAVEQVKKTVRSIGFEEILRYQI